MSDKNTPSTGTQLRKAVSDTAGKLLMQHLAKIVVGLGMLLVLVWNLRGEVEERAARIDKLELRIERNEQRIQRIERMRKRMPHNRQI